MPFHWHLYSFAKIVKNAVSQIENQGETHRFLICQATMEYMEKKSPEHMTIVVHPGQGKSN